MHQLVIDADSHLTEIPTLWTDRLPAKWHEIAPRVEFHEPSKSERWRIGDRWAAGVGMFSRAGHESFPPSYPRTWEEVAPENYDVDTRFAGWTGTESPLRFCIRTSLRSRDTR